MIQTCVPEDKDKKINMYTKFEEWLIENDVCCSNLKLISESNLSQRKLISKTYIEPRTVVVRCPRKSMITREDAIESRMGQEMKDRNFKPQSEQTWLALYILDKLKSETFNSYLNMLPKNFQEFPIFFSAKELEKLKGSLVHGMIVQRLSGLKDEYKSFLSKFPETEHSLEQFIWARLVVISRVYTFQMGNGKIIEAMVPFADMFNHSRKPNTEWEFNINRDEFVMASCRGISKGDELTDSYGTKCCSRFFLNYGFVLDGNQEYNQTSIFIDLKDFSLNDQKKEIIVSPRSFDDGYCNYRKKLVHKFRFKVPIVGTQPNKCITSLFGLVRCLVADTEEMKIWTESEIEKLTYYNDLPKKHQQTVIHQQMSMSLLRLTYISPSNERRTQEVIRKACLKKLSAFESTLEEDKNELHATLTVNERNILKILICEKEVLHWYLHNSEFGKILV